MGLQGGNHLVNQRAMRRLGVLEDDQAVRASAAGSASGTRAEADASVVRLNFIKAIREFAHKIGKERCL